MTVTNTLGGIFLMQDGNRVVADGIMLSPDGNTFSSDGIMSMLDGIVARLLRNHHCF